MVFSDVAVREESLEVFSMERRTVEGIHNTFRTPTAEISIPLHRLSGVTTEEATSIMDGIS
jgi:hypothetical protein